MATAPTIPLKDAMTNRFSSSTTPELLAYLAEVGVEVGDPPPDQAKLRSMLCSALGLSDVSGSERRAQAKPVKAKDPGTIRPPYNLTPLGVWGGRRHRIILPRPEGNTVARAEPVSWNGKPPYWVPYGEVVSVPEPIFNILASRKRVIPMARKTKLSDGSEETTTDWEFADVGLTYIGVDPLTADRCGSMTEWFQKKGPEFYTDKKRSLRELVAVATMLDITTTKSDMMKTPKAEPDLIADILTFLYGYPDVESEAT
jgi:hypothetical protein